MAATWHLQTPSTAPGAVAIFALAAPSADDLEAPLAAAGLPLPPTGRVVLRDLFGIDRGLVARWSPTTAHLMPHAGPAITRLLARRLAEVGLAPNGGGDPRSLFPEAASLLEARMLAALAEAPSPLAIDPLLDQPRRWPQNLHDHADPPQAPAGEAPASLHRLIRPPLVVAIGPANIGKSSLVNALAGRGVAIVADQPGTTRDHIGVTLDLAGLVVRYIDTPGVRPVSADAGAGPERDALALALDVARSADLIILCGDTGSPPLDPGPLGLSGRPVLTVALRSDLGHPSWPADAAASARTGEGQPGLVRRIRDTLIPPAALADPRPWRFWAH